MFNKQIFYFILATTTFTLFLYLICDLIFRVKGAGPLFLDSIAVQSYFAMESLHLLVDFFELGIVELGYYINSRLFSFVF